MNSYQPYIPPVASDESALEPSNDEVVQMSLKAYVEDKLSDTISPSERRVLRRVAERAERALAKAIDDETKRVKQYLDNIGWPNSTVEVVNRWGPQLKMSRVQLRLHQLRGQPLASYIASNFENSREPIWIGKDGWLYVIDHVFVSSPRPGMPVLIRESPYNPFLRIKEPEEILSALQALR